MARCHQKFPAVQAVTKTGTLHKVQCWGGCKRWTLGKINIGCIVVHGHGRGIHLKDVITDPVEFLRDRHVVGGKRCDRFVKLGTGRLADELLHRFAGSERRFDERLVMLMIVARGAIPDTVVGQGGDEGIHAHLLAIVRRVERIAGIIGIGWTAKQVVFVVAAEQVFVGKNNRMWRSARIGQSAVDPWLLLGNRAVVVVAGRIKLIQQDEADIVVVERIRDAVVNPIDRGRLGKIISHNERCAACCRRWIF